MTNNIRERLIRVFGLLSKASARKKVYSLKAGQEKREDVSHVLRAISESESIQARRLFNSLIGKIDLSDHYISTIFEEEIQETIEEYSNLLNQAQQEENKSIITALTQLRAAEKRIKSFYSKQTKDINVIKEERYFVCFFCGYLHTEKIPESCPICGASKNAFQEVH